MGRLFGTDGVRGVANSELTPELAFNIGKAGAFVLRKENERPVIVIGKDTRVSGDMLENALTAGILAVGGNVIKVGVIPTPAVAFLVRHYQADAGIVISASHNSFEFNGIKFFNGEGFKLDDALEDKIEDIIIRDIDTNSHMTGDAIGRCVEAEENAEDLYCDFLLSTADFRLDGMKVVLDCANGASYKTAPRVYRTLGAEVVTIGDDPDGVNINDHIGSTHPEKLQQTVVAEKANIGLAFDGDADRLIVVDEKGMEIKARRAHVVSIAKEGRTDIKEISREVIYIPDCCDEVTPLLTVVPLQLFAYYVAREKGEDIDKPRNLAKSVTVE